MAIYLPAFAFWTLGLQTCSTMLGHIDYHGIYWGWDLKAKKLIKLLTRVVSFFFHIYFIFSMCACTCVSAQRPSQSDTLLPSRPYVLSLPKQFCQLRTKFSNIWVYRDIFIETIMNSTHEFPPVSELPILLESGLLTPYQSCYYRLVISSFLT